ncbi:MAG: bifunctional demethylmenaquinone methyltransferase/2-methoxy-6-polyprenyl-1,4-benzoquinol methylase UbiE [Pseudomonadota bacterium]
MSEDAKNQGGSGADTSFGFAAVPEAARQGLVNEVFAKVAGRYDVMNDLMSGGLHRLWKADLITMLAPPKSDTPFALIDVAGGTGDVASRFLDAGGSACRALICDISKEMMEAGKARAAADGIPQESLAFVQGNAEELPFGAGDFDAYTIAFGIRNVTHIQVALKEAYRVLKPGSRFLCLEFSNVEMPLLDRIYDSYSFNAIPALGRFVAGDEASYRYLVESIRRFPDQESFAQMIREAGFDRVSYRNLTGGIAAIHSGWRL